MVTSCRTSAHENSSPGNQVNLPSSLVFHYDNFPSDLVCIRPITTDYLIFGVFDATADRWALRVQICHTFRSSNINEGSVTSSCVFTNIWIDCLAAVRDRLWPGHHFVLVGIGPRTNTTYMRHSALHHTLWLVGDLSNCVQRHFGVCAHCYHKMNWDQPD